MISVCIPVYNFIIEPLVHSLLEQADAYDIPVEIVLIDDSSLPFFEQENRVVVGQERVRYLALVENIGRSKIRNRLADYASGEWLLFMDCDMKPYDDMYLSRYFQQTREAVDVVCGGINYMPRPEDPRYRLQWQVETHQKRHRHWLRQRGILTAVSTGNFMIRRKMYNRVRFDESLHGYGQEDQLFSMNLREQKARIVWLDNPTVHLGRETNETYLRNVEESLLNLVCIWNANPEHHQVIRHTSRRMNLAVKLQRCGLSFWILVLYNLFTRLIRKTVLRAHSSIFFLHLYQMGFLLRAMRTPNLRTLTRRSRRQKFVRERVAFLQRAIQD